MEMPHLYIKAFIIHKPLYTMELNCTLSSLPSII